MSTERQSSIVAVVSFSETAESHNSITVQFGELWKQDSDSPWRFQFLYDIRYPEDSPLSGLYMTCSIARSGHYCHSWRINLPALQVQYQYSNPEETLDLHVKQVGQIKKAVKKLADYADELGDPTTYGEYILRVLNGLGVKYYVLADNVTGSQSWEYYPITESVKHIRATIDALEQLQYATWNRP